MILFFAIYIIICLYGLKVNVSGFNDEYISRDGTAGVKGIFVLMIIFSHFMNSYTEFSKFDSPVKTVLSNIGQLMVVMFLFYSGYGISESVKKKGRGYVMGLPVGRILKLLVDFDIAILIYVIVNLCMGIRHPLRQILLSLVGWESVGNSNWYVFAILCLYIFSFVAFSIAGKRHYLATTLVTVMCVGYVLVLRNFKSSFWYNTVICYAAGMWYSLLREKIEGLVQRNNILWTLSLIVCGGMFLICQRLSDNFIFYECHALLFVACVVLFTMKVKIGNPALVKMGDWVFGVYILQRIPMRILDNFGILESQMYLSFVVTVVATLVLAFLYSYITKYTGIFFKKIPYRLGR